MRGSGNAKSIIDKKNIGQVRVERIPALFFRRFLNGFAHLVSDAHKVGIIFYFSLFMHALSV